MIPVTKTYYCNTASFPGTTFGELSDGVAPPQTNTTWGWNVGQNNPPLFCEMNCGLEVNRTSSQWQASPTQSIPTQNAGGMGDGNCWMTGPIKGEFLSGNWQITMSVKSITVSSGHDGQFIYRIWKGPSIDGSDATLITSSFISSSLISIVGTVLVSSGSISFPLPYINLHDEYLFFQTYWSIITKANNNSADTDYVLGINKSLIVSSPFIKSNPQIMMVDL